MIPKSRLPILLVALIFIQGLSAAFFLSDVVDDGFGPAGQFFPSLHILLEALATFGLIFAILFEAKYLMEFLRRHARMEQNMRVATGALNDVIEEYFTTWSLTPSEKDVAMFAIKGMSNLEIAELRKSSEGTIKAHLNAVFRKAGVNGRSQLVSLLIEDLMGHSLIGQNKA
jgi:DNA-binding CsgD family transcriptional regulator